MCVRFGLPFVLHLEKTIAWDLLQKEILEKMKYFLRPTVCIQVGRHLDAPAQHACVPNDETVPAEKFEFWTSALREDQTWRWDAKELCAKLFSKISCVQIFKTEDLAPHFLATARISLNYWVFLYNIYLSNKD